MIDIRAKSREMVVIVDEARELGEAPMPAAVRFIEGLVADFARERLNMLDEAWAQINSIGGTHRTGDRYGEGLNAAVGQALACLESLGAKDPATRKRP